MNGTNKAAIGVVFGIALLYSALCLVATVLGMLDGTVSLSLFAPHEGGLWVDLSDVAVLEHIAGAYSGFVGLFGEEGMVSVLVAVLGFALSAIGLATPWARGVKGTDNPAEYLWTKRPRATLRALGAPWGLIPTAWNKHKALVIVPVLLLPLYAVWSLIMTVSMIVPYLIVKGVIGLRVRSAAKGETRALGSATMFAVCPKCKRNFASPKVRCKCGLVLDYPVPNEYGYKTHTCNNGHQIPCVHGKREGLFTVCPYCGEDIETREAVPVTIAMVGASGAGKTTLMLAAVGTITQVARSKDVAVDAVTPGISKQAVAAKDVAPRTASGELDSECMFLRSRDMEEHEIIINDISGTEFEPKEGKVLFEEYYNYADGIVFAFDPLALGHGRGYTPMDVFESFHSMFTQINGVGPGTVSNIPFAVVATKNDVMNPPLQSANVRQFLVSSGQEGFVRVLESVFSDVRYFAASSVGDDCRSAAAPFWWIVGKSDQELATKVPVLSVRCRVGIAIGSRPRNDRGRRDPPSPSVLWHSPPYRHMQYS